MLLNIFWSGEAHRATYGRSSICLRPPISVEMYNTDGERADRQIDTQTDRLIVRKTDTDRQADRLAGRQTNRQTVRQTDK